MSENTVNTESKNVVPRLKFPNCANSMVCLGCDAKSFKESPLIHNQDVIVYKSKVERNRYYEIVSIYESQTLADGSLLPDKHGIRIEQFKKFEDVEDLPGVYACGGTAFILRKYNVRKNKMVVLCINGWSGYEDGWHN
jgi:hypothetical protein